MYAGTDYRSVYRAWRRFHKGKKATVTIDQFAYNLEENVERLSQDLMSQTYHHGGYKKVVSYEKKRRDLAVASVCDRVVHRLLYDYLVVIFDKCFDSDVWSCRTGFGLHGCLGRTQKLLQRRSTSFVWRSDITKFFDHVDHARLIECLVRKIGKDKTAMWLCQEVISSYNVTDSRQTAHGIPIGNLTSQIFSNIYLNEFDRFVRHELKPQAYIRYGDDFLLFATTRRQAWQYRAEAQMFLINELKLTLNPKNDVVVAAKDGLNFLGHAITKDYAVVDRHTTRSVLQKVSANNISSYRALYLVKGARSRLDWLLLE